MRRIIWLAALLSAGLFAHAGAFAQTPDNPGGIRPVPAPLGALVQNADSITVLRVVKVEKDAIVYESIARLKGKRTSKEVRHQRNLGAAAEGWLRPGRTAVCFCREGRASICLGNFWYYAWNPDGAATAKLWHTEPEPDGFERAYVGPVEKLREAVTAIRAGKEAIVTVRKPHDARDGPGESPIRRDGMRGQKGPVWRVKASLKIDNFEDVCCEESRHFVGRGVGDRSAVPALLVALEHEDPQVRAEAAEDLGGVGAEARDALPALRKALDDGDGHVRVFAAAALARIDPDNKQTVPLLRAALTGGTSDVRYAALAALAEIGPRARPARPVVVKLLREEPDEALRSVAAFVIGRIGPGDDSSDALAALGRALREDRSAEVRLWAVRALRPFGAEAKAALPALAVALTRGDSELTREAADVLARFGAPGVPALAAALTEEHRSVEEILLPILEDMGPVARPAVPAILRVMERGDVMTRREAAFALWEIDPQTARGKTLPVLVEVLKGGELKCGSHSLRALRILQEMGPGAKEAAPAVIAALKDESPLWSGWIRTDAARTLTRLGSGVEEAAAALEAALRDEQWNVRVEAARALWQLRRPRETVPVLLDSLHSENEVCRRAAADAFGDMGPAARAALPALRKAMRKKDDPARLAYARAVCRIERRVEFGNVVVEPRRDALEVLAEIAGTADPCTALSAACELSQFAPDMAVPALRKALNHKDIFIREDAALTLARLGPSARPAVPALKARLKDDDHYTSRAAVAVALCRLGETEAGMPVLIHALEREPGFLRRFEEEIGPLGPKAKALVPCLERALWEGDYSSAARLLRHIDPKAASRVGVP